MLEFYDHGQETFTPDQPIPACRWDRFDLLMAHTGCLQITFSRKRQLDLQAGTAVLIYPHTRFEGVALSKECRVTVQHFAFKSGVNGSDVAAPMRRFFGKRQGFELLRITDFSGLQRDVQRALELAFEPESAWVHDTRVALMTLIFSRMDAMDSLTLPGHARDWDSLDAWLRTQLHRPITVAHMAGQLGLSPGHFSTCFRQRMGISPAKHLLRLRMQEARRLLRETRLPVKVISERLTYEDLPNFYRAFRKAVGDTPAAYRGRYKLRG